MAKQLCFGGRCIKADVVIRGILLLSMILLPVRGYALEVGDKGLTFRPSPMTGK